MRRFEDHVVVITGSATGIGAATARRFAAEGAKVACLDINEADNDATAAAARSEGVEAMALTCDVRSRHDQQVAFDRTLAAWGRIDVPRGLDGHAGYHRRSNGSPYRSRIRPLLTTAICQY